MRIHKGLFYKKAPYAGYGAAPHTFRPILLFALLLSYFARFCIQWGQTRRARISEGGDTLGNLIGREGAALIVLTLALCAVFALSVQMYDTLEAETADGALAAAADAARGFLSENEAVAAFLGFSADADAIDADADAQVDEAAVRAAAADYIARYNKIYAELR